MLDQCVLLFCFRKKKKSNGRSFLLCEEALTEKEQCMKIGEM